MQQRRVLMTAHQIQQNKNFLDTFGYLRLELPSNFNYDDYKNDVIKASTLLMNSEWKDIVAQKRSFIVPAFADNSSIGSEFLVNYLDNQIKPLFARIIFILEAMPVYFLPRVAHGTEILQCTCRFLN